MPFPVCRARTRALIVSVCLVGATVGAPGAALAQSAGNDQYQDPLAGGTSKKTQKVPSATPVPGPTPQLTPTAGTSSGSGSGSTATGSAGASPGTARTTPGGTTGSAPAQSSATRLPNTGVDGRIVASLGLGLLLCGLGLRLRTARERF